jgi:hypothetical protein
VSQATPLSQRLNTISVALQASKTAPEATSIRGALPSEANFKAGAEAGMQSPRTVVTATAATTEAAASRIVAGATEATLKGGRGLAPEAGTGLAGRPHVVHRWPLWILCLTQSSLELIILHVIFKIFLYSEVNNQFLFPAIVMYHTVCLKIFTPV